MASLNSASRGLFVAAWLVVAAAPRAGAHCDGMDGPVVAAARAALETRDVRRALIWVAPSVEGEIREAFARAVAVRKQRGAARELADRYFFETLVRLHRAGEGEPYTGLKPAGRDLGPVIPAADRAVDSGDLQPLLELVTGSVRQALEERFERVRATAKFAPGDLEAGRRFVAEYVSFLHAAEAVHDAAHPARSEPAGAHGHEPAPAKATGP